MKFSDLVVLGSTIINFDSRVFLLDGCGCLIGMAAAAKTGAITSSVGRGGNECLAQFPWLEEWNRVLCPVCSAWYPHYSGAISCVAVHVQAHEWTFEQALDYIRSIEPQDDVIEESQALQNVYA